MGFPLCGRARVPSAQPREGSDGTPSRLRGRSFRETCESFAAKAVSDVVPCAVAHDRQTFPFGERRGKKRLAKGGRGQGGKAPTPKRWRCGNRGERARARAFPNGTEAPAAKRLGVRPGLPRQRGLGGFQRGASSTPLWSGDSQGGETPLRLSLPTFCRGRK